MNLTNMVEWFLHRTFSLGCQVGPKVVYTSNGNDYEEIGWLHVHP